MTEQKQTVVDGGSGAMLIPALNLMVTPLGMPLSQVKEPVVGTDYTTDEYVPWGDDNLFAQRVIADVRTNHIISSGLERKMLAAASGGIAHGFTYINEKNQSVRCEVQLPSVMRGFRATNPYIYIAQAFNDVFYFRQPYARLIKNYNGDKIVAIQPARADRIRLGWQNKRGITTQCFLNPDWANYRAEKNIALPVLSELYAPVYQLQQSEASDFILSGAIPTQGADYYAMAPWNPIRVNGWLKFANSIPAFKEAIMKNQMTILWHFEVPEDFWERIFKNDAWDTLTVEQKRSKKADFFADLFKNTKGDKNAGANLFTEYQYDESHPEGYGGWKIHQYDLRAKESLYIEDSREAVEHLCYAIDVDPALIGKSGTSLGGGSGSNKRVGSNIEQNNMFLFRQFVLRPFEIKADFNNEHQELRDYLTKRINDKTLKLPGVDLDNVFLEYWLRSTEVNTLDNGSESTVK